MTTESMKALARKRAQHDYKPRKGTAEEPVPTYTDKRHANADVVKGRNERAMGKGMVDVEIGNPEFESTNKEPYVELTMGKMDMRKTDVQREGTYPEMPEPKDRSSEKPKKKFSMMKSLLQDMRDLDGDGKPDDAKAK